MASRYARRAKPSTGAITMWTPLGQIIALAVFGGAGVMGLWIIADGVLTALERGHR